MQTINEFMKLTDDKLRTLLEKHEVFCPPKIEHSELIDYAINKLHGHEFVHEDEAIINNKIIRTIKSPTPVPGEQCPSCKQDTLKKMNLLDSDTHSGFVHCGYCGLYLSPAEQIKVLHKTPEKPKSKTSEKPKFKTPGAKA